MPESGASTSPLGDLCNNNQLLKKGAGKKVIKKKKKSDLAKPEGRSCGAKPPEKQPGARRGPWSSSAVLVGTCAGTDVRGCSRRAAGAAEGQRPWAGRAACSTGKPQAGSLGLILSASLPLSLLPSLPCLFHTEILCKVVL